MNNFLKLVVVALLFIVISGCETQKQNAQPQTDETTIRIPLETSISTIDPGLKEDNFSAEIVEQLFLGLTDFDPETYEVMPEFAKTWETNEDGTIYTFKLRQDVKWTNGEPVTAHDVVWAIQRNLVKSPLNHTLFILKNAKATLQGKSLPLGVRAIDDYTVEFTLEHAASYFPAKASMWTYSPLPRKVVKKYEKYGKDWTKQKHIQTNGSYQLVEWKKGKRLVLEKNPQYYNAKQVQIQKIHYLVIPKSLIRLAMYKSNKLDILGGKNSPFPRSEMPYLNSDATLRRELHHVKIFQTVFYGFNTKKSPMDKPLVRKAIAAAIDKQVLIDFIIWANSTPATTFTSPSNFGSVAPEEQIGIQFDPKQAKKWLKQAGYDDEHEFPKNVILAYDAPSENFANVAKAIQIMLKRFLNIDIQIKGYTDFYDKIEQPSTPHIFRLAWDGDYPDADNWLHEVFHPKDGYNWVGWDSHEFAETVEKAQLISDTTERKRLYRRAEQILTEEEAVIVPLYFSNVPILVKPWVKGWYNMAIGGQHIRNWRLENGGR
ncbi:peptide ABC transporter substrate-binding protein [Candidatus Parabeggiatoa sp. HSG14]|uniref:peptide ABC transporter substrate-binding protein n=1 Tax=Candidatus Parabeggiatoa sp. HSG14 TaxID=3055593 RepID=UPI0025A6D013|nr:peptide ABC transporter substrate-binding protein [Thiotrichales bacterium HSG14]